MRTTTVHVFVAIPGLPWEVVDNRSLIVGPPRGIRRFCDVTTVNDEYPRLHTIENK